MCNSSIGCPICMGEHDPPAQLGSIDACQHIFCFSCIKEWLDTCSTCPICKQDVAILHKHTLTIDSHALLGKSEHLGIGDAHAVLQQHAPSDESFHVEKRQLPQEDPDPDSIPDHGHSDICEGGCNGAAQLMSCLESTTDISVLSVKTQLISHPESGQFWPSGALSNFLQTLRHEWCGAVCHIDRDDHLALLCDSCNRCYHAYCVNLDHIPEDRWFCEDCDIDGAFVCAPSTPNQMPLSAHHAPAQAANLLARATRGSAMQLNNWLPRVRSRTVVRGSQPGRAVRSSHGPRRSARVVTVDDDSDTASWSSDTPIAMLRPNSRARPDTMNNADVTSAQSDRHTEQSRRCPNQCSTRSERTESCGCSEAAVKQLEHSPDGRAAPVSPDLGTTQQRPRLRVRSSQHVQPDTSDPCPASTSTAQARDASADGTSHEMCGGSLQADKACEPHHAAARRIPLSSTHQLTCSHKRVREGCFGDEAAAKSVKLHTSENSIQSCLTDPSKPLAREHVCDHIPGHGRQSSNPCLRATGPNARLYAVRLAKAPMIPRTCSSRMRQSTGAACGSHPPVGTVRIRNTTHHQTAATSTEECVRKVRDCCRARSASAEEHVQRDCGSGLAAPHRRRGMGEHDCCGASSTVSYMPGEISMKGKKNKASRIAQSSKTVADKMLRKMVGSIMFVDGVRRADADEAIEQAAVCIADGLVAMHNAMNQDIAQSIAQDACSNVVALFSDSKAEHKAHKYLAVEILRFSAHLVGEASVRG